MSSEKTTETKKVNTSGVARLMSTATTISATMCVLRLLGKLDLPVWVCLTPLAGALALPVVVLAFMLICAAVYAAIGALASMSKKEE